MGFNLLGMPVGAQGLGLNSLRDRIQPQHRDKNLNLSSKRLGFVSLPGLYCAFLGGATVTYLLFVEMVKRRLLREERAAANHDFPALRNRSPQ
jgi:hypothetical protein